MNEAQRERTEGVLRFVGYTVLAVAAIWFFWFSDLADKPMTRGGLVILIGFFTVYVYQSSKRYDELNSKLDRLIEEVASLKGEGRDDDLPFPLSDP